MPGGTVNGWRGGPDGVRLEVVRRGLESMVRIYAARQAAETEWQLPQPRRLGAFLAPEDQWRTLANEG